MMTSSNGNILRVTGPLCEEFTGRRWIALIKASDLELCCFFYLCLNKRLNKQSRNRCLRRHRAHYDVTVMPSDLTVMRFFNSWEAGWPRVRFWSWRPTTTLNGPCLKWQATWQSLTTTLGDAASSRIRHRAYWMLWRMGSSSAYVMVWSPI